jgi:hypothetical protein
MTETDVSIGQFKIGIVFESNEEGDQQRRVQVLTQWLLDTFEKERREAKDVEPRSAG